jgi:hypothetical protein
MAHANRHLFEDFDVEELLLRAGLEPSAARRYAAALPGHHPAAVVGQYLSDLMFRRRITEWLDLRRNAAPTWVYDFAWRSQVSGVADHCLDVPYGEMVDDPADADVALLRLKAPYEPRSGGFEARFHAGSLEFPADERDHHAAICSAVPTVVDVYLDRPAVLTDLVPQAAAVLGSYGSSDEAFLDVVFGIAQPAGSLPFDLPRSMAAVEASRSDVPYDTADPLFRFGHGLRYA